MFRKQPTPDPSSVWHPWDRNDLACSWCVLPELDGLVKRFSVHGRDIAHEQGAPGTASPLQTGSAGSPTCRATARILGLPLSWGEMTGFPDRENKFPVPVRREFSHKAFKLLPNFEPLAGRRRPREQNSLYFPS